MFDAIGKTKEMKKEVRVDARFPMKCSTHDSIERIPIEFNPTNQTTNIEKIPKDLNHMKTYKIPSNSKEP